MKKNLLFFNYYEIYSSMQVDKNFYNLAKLDFFNDIIIQLILK